MANLKERYQNEVVAQLKEQFSYANVMQVPRITKVTLNMGIGDAVSDKKLIDNAIDFSAPNGAIDIRLRANGPDLTLSISNEGPGIPENLLSSIFDSMVTARANNPDNRLHFGMGLYVVRVIADHHSGSVQVENLREPSGVRVSVTLPSIPKPSAKTS